MPEKDSLKLARLWTALDEVKCRLDNEVMPLAYHLSLEDPELMIALESLSEKIGDHFARYRLQAVAATCA